MRLEAIALPLVRLALTEDLGEGDATTDAVVDEGAAGRAHIAARSRMASSPAAKSPRSRFASSTRAATIDWLVAEGGPFKRGSHVATITGKARAISERRAGGAQLPAASLGNRDVGRAFVKAVEGTGVRILDTRKTTPGLRFLEKHAAHAGGAVNHRFGLFDGVLIKENHIVAAGGLKQAVERARKGTEGLPVVVEVKSQEEALEAADLKPDRILLDNFTPSAIMAVLKRMTPGPEIEVSGGIRLANVRDFALPGVSYISVGAITHSAPAIDLSLVMDEVKATA